VQAPAATPPTARWTNSLGQIFVPVPGTKARFCIWDTRVQDFAAFVKATGYNAVGGMLSVQHGVPGGHGDTWQSPGFAQGPTCPVVGVNWDDAKAFCAWLTQQEQAAGKITSGQSYRLPTDAEWSLAVGLNEADGGLPKEKSGRIQGIYPWGANWPPPKDAGNYAGGEARDANWPSSWPTLEEYRDGYARTSPVGSFPANRFDLYDMGGNVWQWCEDRFDGTTPLRVFRGASCFDWNQTNLLSSYRGASGPRWRYGRVGFRCVLGEGAAP
jgi:formylglycine-generating enzyme required for sulfatase activity